MCGITHLTLKPMTATTLYFLKLPTALMLTVVGIAKLFSHYFDTSLTFGREQVSVRRSVNNLFSAADEIFFDPEATPALARRGPFGATLITKFCTTSAAVVG